ncbi:MAG: 50S ribosomal protein L4 [Nitrospirales bacterium]|nr:50S ribosomal protein L4 [Nitrospirales bacterium]
MLEIAVKDINNNAKGTIALTEEIFSNTASESLVHTAVVAYMANQRQGTHATKTRGLVSGGGKKPWKQKSTGRARSGSSRSPIWRGGGTVFGPEPRDYSISLPKTMRRTALCKALTMKLADGEISVVDGIVMEKAKTREMASILKNLGLAGKKVLVVVPEKDENVCLSVQNIPTAGVIRVNDLHAFHIAAFDHILFTEGALKRMQGNGEVA